MPRLLRLALPLGLALALASTGCLGTVVETPSPAGRSITSTQIHLLAAPMRIDAHVCEKGIARSFTFVPLVGVAVGILTLGIVVPKTTVYRCVGSQ